MPDPIEVRIEKLVYGGEGLGHHDGHTVFVPFVLPDETVSIEPLETAQEIYSRPRRAASCKPSPDRVGAAAARTSASAADATTSTCRTNCRCATKRTFCARRFRASGAYLGRSHRAARVAALRISQPRPVEDRADDDRRRAKSDISRPARRSFAPCASVPSLSPRLSETLSAMSSIC